MATTTREARLLPSRRRFGVILSSIVLLAACQPSLPMPATYYTPEIAGVVKAHAPGPGRIQTFTLTDDTEVAIDGAHAVQIRGGGNASVDDLLLADHTASWLSSLRITRNIDAPPGCFELAEAGMDDGDYIRFTNGLRLHKAADFDPGRSSNGIYQIPRSASFCVNAAGEVTQYRS